MKKSLRLFIVFVIVLTLSLSTASLALAQTGGNGGNGGDGGNNCNPKTVEGLKSAECHIGGTALYINNVQIEDGETWISLVNNPAVPDGYSELGDGVKLNSDFYGSSVVCFRIPPGQKASDVLVAINYGDLGIALINPNITSTADGSVDFACAQVFFTPDYAPMLTLVVADN